MDSVEEKLFEKFGPVMGGQELHRALGFNSYGAFYRSKALGELGVNVFRLPGRRGWFALTEDVAGWIGRHAGRGAIR